MILIYNRETLLLSLQNGILFTAIQWETEIDRWGSEYIKIINTCLAFKVWHDDNLWINLNSQMSIKTVEMGKRCLIRLVKLINEWQYEYIIHVHTNSMLKPVLLLSTQHDLLFMEVHSCILSNTRVSRSFECNSWTGCVGTLHHHCLSVMKQHFLYSLYSGKIS